MDICYIQIFELIPVCSRIKKQIRVIITPEEKFLKTEGQEINNNFPFVSEIRTVSILKTFKFSLELMRRVFVHASDKILDIFIHNHKLYIIGDNEEILFDTRIEENIELNRIPFILAASKTFLDSKDLNYF
jgi:hypothetical protein